MTTDTRHWPATYFDGRSSLPRPAAVWLDATGLSIRLADAASPLAWPFEELRQVQGQFPGQQVHLTRWNAGSGWLVIEDESFLAALAERAGPTHKGLKAPLPRRAFLRRALGAFAGLALVISGLYGWVLPRTVEAATPHVPVAWEEKLGAIVIDQVAPKEVRVWPSDYTFEIQALLKRLTAAADSPYTYRLYVVYNGEVNAYALPGGYIVVNTGLLEKTDSPEELMGVLAHEIQHVHQRHTTRSLLYGLGLQAIATALTGDTTMGTLAWGMGLLKQSREAELEADVRGMQLLHDAGVDPQGMVTFFRKMEADEEAEPGIFQYLSTHPATGERVSTLKRLAEEATSRPEAVQLGYRWQSIRVLGADEEVE